MAINLDPDLIGDPYFESNYNELPTLTFTGSGAEYVADVLRKDRVERERRAKEDAVNFLVRDYAGRFAHKDTSASSLHTVFAKFAYEVAEIEERFR